jgi:DNA-binding NarL/FixJ family response regulator
MNILIVDAANDIRQKLIKYLQLEKIFDYVFETQTVKEAQRIMETIKVDIILFDIQLPNKSGLDLMSMKDKLFYKPVMIVCSNYKLPQYLKAYDNLLVDRFFDKSSELAELKSFIKHLVNKEKDNPRVRNHKLKL